MYNRICIMEDLFSTAKAQHEPLASRMRPRNLDEYIGQDHIVGKGRLLRRAIAADQLTSVIFYGPPGSGKTTLARVIANHTKSNFITLNAVLTGVADIRAAIKQAEEYYNLYNRHTILFVDEVHRWNKAQQDALLPWVENGTIILIGATTENPFFEVNKALVSRSRVFQLKPLTSDDLKKASTMALTDTERGYGHWNIQFETGALEHLIDTANGDARSLLNALELAVETTPEKWSPSSTPPVPEWGSTIYISKEACEESIQKKVVLYDKDGDYHYDIISAFIKSLRGRDPDAAMYWLARMVRAGEDPDFIFRRMLISACEDTGMADPYALSVVTSCAQAFDRVGMPEGRYHLAHAALYLATSPKSNSSMAFFDALASVEKEDADVPNHLRDANRDSEGFGHGDGYLYPHAYRDHWVAQQYLPDALVGRVFYTPTNQGYEAKIREDVLSRRELQITQILENSIRENAEKSDKSEFGSNPIAQWWVTDHFKTEHEAKGEQLTFSPKDNRKESALDKADRSWRARLDTNRTEVLLSIRNNMTKMANLCRHYRSLVWNADDGLLLWEIARKTPEGVTCGLCRSQKGLEVLDQYGRTLNELDKPILLTYPTDKAGYLSPESFKDILQSFQYKGAVLDRIFFRDPFASVKAVEALAQAFLTVTKPVPKERDYAFTDEIDDPQHDKKNADTDKPLSPSWLAVIAQRIPRNGQRISDIIKDQILKNAPNEAIFDIADRIKTAEESFFTSCDNVLFNWDSETICKIFSDTGFAVRADLQILTEKRRITDIEIDRWFDTNTSAYGKALIQNVSGEEIEKIKNLLKTYAQKQLFNWNSEVLYLTVGEV